MGSLGYFLMMSSTIEPIKWVLSNLHPIDLALALLGLFAFVSVHRRLTTNGPMLWPVVGMVPSFIRHIHEFHDWNARALIECGATYPYRAFWMSNCRGIMTSDPAKVEYMLKTHFLNFPKGPYYRERFRELLGYGIFNADGDAWKEQRRLVTSLMHTTRFINYSIKTMQSLVRDKLIPLIETTSPTSIDLQEWLLRFTFDNVCIVALGVDPGCLSLHLPSIPFAGAFEIATELSLFRFLVPPFWWKTLRLLNLGPERRLKDAVEVVHGFADATVTKRKSDVTDDVDDDDLLSRLILTRPGFSDKFLRDLCVSFILAGRDTSSVALAWFFWLVHCHPHVERKILEEIKGVVERDKVVVFEAEELERMVYLEAALTEAMRLYPPVPIDFKEVMEDDEYPTNDGVRVSKGDRVFYHIYAMGRIKEVWGPDCTEFRPERWLRDGKMVAESQYKYTVFNGGPRLCAGKKFAYLQMKMVAACVLWRYKVVVEDGHKVVPKVTTTLYMKHGLQVRFHPRTMIN